MATYIYKCKNCDHTFEVRQKMSAKRLTDCPKCGQPQLKKVITATPVIYATNGFYATDGN